MKKQLLIFTVLIIFLSSCASRPSVKRINSETHTDLSGYWNDSDVRIVCKSLIESCLTSPRVDQEIKAKRVTPTIIIGRFKNDSSEHIDTEIITSIMRTTIINSGKLDFVAGGDEREAIRTERQDQQSNASESTASSLGNETGADFMLTGSVKTIIDRSENTTIRTYFVTAELTSIETNRIIWTDQNNEIKKTIVRPKNKL